MVWSTVSNAAERSSSVNTVKSPQSSASRISDETQMTVKKHQILLIVMNHIKLPEAASINLVPKTNSSTSWSACSWAHLTIAVQFVSLPSQQLHLAQKGATKLVSRHKLRDYVTTTLSDFHCPCLRVDHIQFTEYWCTSYILIMPHQDYLTDNVTATWDASSSSRLHSANSCCYELMNSYRL